NRSGLLRGMIDSPRRLRGFSRVKKKILTKLDKQWRWQWRWAGLAVVVLVLACAAFLWTHGQTPRVAQPDTAMLTDTHHGFGQVVAGMHKNHASAVGPSANKAKNGASNPASIKKEFEHYARLGSTLGEVPSSLSGTRVDGHVAADSSGQLIVSVGVKQMFDYFLSTLGEEDLNDVKGRIAFYL